MARFHPTLRTRIYLSMLAIILISSLVTGGIAIYDHFEQNEKYNILRLERKEKAVKASMEYFLNQLGGFMKTDSVPLMFSDKICELSDVHNLFIILYDLRGRYLISTNSMRMDSLKVTYQIDYTALKQLSTGNERVVIDKEFKNENYNLAYWYFDDLAGKPIAITSVVYDKSDSESKDLWAFLRELGQSYIILFLLAALAAYLLSRYITRSLQLISKRMHQVQLGKKNEPLEWTSNDEIGALVSEYNKMLAELETSATRLAQTERESAWREMAQQVAHEIKNPLTPMKLRVQHLQRSWHDGNKNFDERLEVFAKSMTEQIDTLSRIATEFSHFAKMPKPDLADIDIHDLLSGVVDLYRENADITLEFRPCNSQKILVVADKEQTLRVFNNLLNNAVQSIPTGKHGRIDVATKVCKNNVVVRVSDNGIGIDEKRRLKIFTPNFTTKSTGTGLGLAMVKNIMEQSGGRVWFWSREGKGASFYCAFQLTPPVN